MDFKTYLFVNNVYLTDLAKKTDVPYETLLRYQTPRVNPSAKIVQEITRITDGQVEYEDIAGLRKTRVEVIVE